MKTFKSVEISDITLSFPYCRITDYNNLLHYYAGFHKVVSAGSFVVGTEYKIAIAGDTDFTAIGASDSNVDTEFTATGAGSGTGKAVVYTTTSPNTDASVFDSDLDIIERTAFIPIGTYTRKELAIIVGDYFSLTATRDINEVNPQAELDLRYAINDVDNYPTIFAYNQMRVDYTSVPGRFLTNIIKFEYDLYELEVANGHLTGSEPDDYVFEGRRLEILRFHHDNYNDAVASSQGFENSGVFFYDRGLMQRPAATATSSAPYRTSTLQGFVFLNYETYYQYYPRFFVQQGVETFLSTYDDYSDASFTNLMRPEIEWKLIDKVKLENPTAQDSKDFDQYTNRAAFRNTMAAGCFFIPSTTKTAIRENELGRKSIWPLLGFTTHSTRHQIVRSGYQRIHGRATHYLPENVYVDSVNNYKHHQDPLRRYYAIDAATNFGANSVLNLQDSGYWNQGAYLKTRNRIENTTNFTREDTIRDPQHRTDEIDVLRGPQHRLVAGKSIGTSTPEDDDKATKTINFNKPVYVYVNGVLTSGNVLSEYSIENANAKIYWDRSREIIIKQSTGRRNQTIVGVSSQLRIELRDEYGNFLDLEDRCHVTLKFTTNQFE